MAVLKATGGPGSIQFLLLAVVLGIAVVWWWPKRRRLGFAWLTVIGVSYLLMSVPVMANGIADRLPLVAAPHASTIATLVLLDGDNRRGRVREAKRVLASQHPAAVWVLGGRWILEALAEGGVERSAFRLDGRADTTLLQMNQVPVLARASAPGQTAVIVSRLQAPRVAARAARLGAAVWVLPAPIDVEPPRSGLGQFVPSYYALRISRDAIYEHAALAWYRYQGWIDR